MKLEPLAALVHHPVMPRYAARACDDAHRRAGLLGADAVELLEQGSTALGGDARCTVRAWRCAAPAAP